MTSDPHAPHPAQAPRAAPSAHASASHAEQPGGPAQAAHGSGHAHAPLGAFVGHAPPPGHPPRKVQLLPSHPSSVAAMLAYAGLLPFVLGAALVWIVNERAHEHALRLLSLYAAAVVSFLGGIHWGLAMRADSGEANADRRLSWGAAPVAVAWIAALMPAHAGLVVQAGMLIACYLVDRRSYPMWGAAAWLTLRFRLTAVAALSCFLGAAGA